jgi:hypothetical protein
LIVTTTKTSVTVRVQLKVTGEGCFNKIEAKSGSTVVESFTSATKFNSESYMKDASIVLWGTQTTSVTMVDETGVAAEQGGVAAQFKIANGGTLPVKTTGKKQLFKVTIDNGDEDGYWYLPEGTDTTTIAADN